MQSTWHPRGEASWPEWKIAEPGTRVEHVRSQRRGTFKRAVVGGGGAGATYAVIEWDARPPFMGGRTVVGRVVAPAFDLRPIDKEKS